MHPCHALLLLFFAFLRSDYLTVVNQSESTSPGPFDPRTGLISQNYTDLHPSPVLQGADEFVISSSLLPLSSNTSVSFTTFVFTFVTIRTRIDANPTSLTLQLFYHDSARGCPETTPFFTRTFFPRTWDPRVDTPVKLTLALNQGLSSDDGLVMFQPNNRTFLPLDTTLWVSFYGGLAAHYSVSTGLANHLYWLTAAPIVDNSTNSTNSTVSNTSASPLSLNYQYRDTSNLLQRNLTNWTDASLVQALLGTTPLSTNLSWSLVLQYSLVILTPPATEAPTPVPTATIWPIVNNNSAPPTYTNFTGWVEGTIGWKGLELMIILSALLLLTIGVCIIIGVAIKRKRVQLHKEKHGLSGPDPLDTKQYLVEMKERGTHRNSTDSTYKPYQVADNIVETVSTNRKEHRPLISDTLYSEVSLDDIGGGDQGKEAREADWLQRVMPTDGYVTLDLEVGDVRKRH